MKKQLFLILSCIVLISCSQSSNYIGPVIEPGKIAKDMMSWLYYERDYMRWSADYEALDPSLNEITKGEFLKRLTTGDYLPVKIRTRDSSLYYQLYPLDGSEDKEIGEVISNKAQLVYQYYKMEGKPLPKFHFTDLNGNVYDATTTRGKTLVVNCWFIHCKPCNEEMPRLNQLVEQFANRKDILFVGLAFDPAEDLKKFLKKTAFNYAIVPDKEDYLMNDLQISGYPTHIIINKQGLVEKVIQGDVEEFINVLDEKMMHPQ